MEYIDLGLKSGTLWADANENGFYTFREAVVKFGNRLPTKEQWEELINFCTWEWNGSGYDVIGQNDNYIVLPAVGFLDYCEDVVDVGDGGGYWSSTPDGTDYAWDLFFNSVAVYAGSDGRHNGFSVRLVK